MQILHRTEDPHLVYTEALARLTVDGAPPKVVTSRLKRFSSPHYPVRAVISALAALLLVVDIYRARPWRQAVLVREFWNIPLLITSPLVWPLARRILFNINHNLTGAGGAVPRPIRFLARIGFRFVLFDGATSVARFPSELRSAFIAPPFPSVALPQMRVRHGQPFRVGLVGSLASINNQSTRFFDQLARIVDTENVVLCYGARDFLPHQLAQINGVQIVDTRSRENFRTYLYSLDIAIFVASADSYFHRHSGTVMDAVSAGVVPVVPSFPVLLSQVSNPCQVGIAYCGLDALPGAVDRAVASLDALSNNRLGWHNARKNPDVVAESRQ